MLWKSYRGGRRWFAVGLLVIPFLAAVGDTARGQGDSEPLIRVDVRLVHVIATVKDAAGGLVADLNKDDFQILDSGVPQQLSVFEKRSEQPLSVTLLIDTSGSTAKDLRYETDSISRFVKSLLNAGNVEDVAALYSFNWEVVRHTGFTRNFGAIDRNLRTLKGEAGTALYDAIFLSAGELRPREGRKVMVVVTDGGDTTSSKDFHAALQAAQAADAVIYPILVVPITNSAGRNIGGENALAGLAADTGGRVFAPTVGDALDKAFAELLSELRTQYFLGYYPRNVPASTAKFHRLAVQTRRPGLRVSARAGYYESSSGGSAQVVGFDSDDFNRIQSIRRAGIPKPKT